MQIDNQNYLIIEPNASDALLLEIMLIKIGISKKSITTVPEVDETDNLQDRSFDFVFWGFDDVAGDNRAIYTHFQESFNRPVIIVMVPRDNSKLAIEFLRVGVSDYLIKGEYDAKGLQKSLLISRQRKELQRELERREARFRGLIEHNFDGIVITDENRIITYVSPSVETITGYSPDELVGHSNTKFISVEDQKDNNEIVVNLTTGTVSDGKFKERYRTKSGEYRWIETRVSDCRHIPGLNGFVVNFRDIHEEEMANRARKHAEEKANMLIESTSDGVWQWNLETEAIFWSDSIYKMLGYEFNGALQNMSIEEITHPEDRNILKSTMLENAKNGRSFQAEFRVRNADGAYLWMIADGSGLSGDSGKTELIIGTLRNINQRKEAEMALTESRTLLKNLTHNLGGSVARHIVNIAGEAEVVFLNNGASEVFGIPSEEIQANPDLVWEGILPADLPKLNDAFVHALKNDMDFELVFRFRTPSGLIKHLHTRGTLQHTEAGVMVDSITMDATPLKKAEEEIAEHESLLQNILDNVDGVIQRYRKNSDGSYEMLYFSEGQAKITGVDMEALTSDFSAATEQIDPEHLAIIQQKIEESSKTLEPWSHIWKMTDTRGVVKWVSGQGSPVRQADGSVIWNQVLTDITKLKEIEKKLRRASERFELAARAAQLGVWEFNVKTDELVWDDTMLEIFGTDRAQFKGTSGDWLEALHPDDRDSALAEVKKAVETELGMYQSQFRIINKKTGNIKHIRATGRFAGGGEEHGRILVGLNWDVTFMEEARQKLADSNRRYELASQATSDAVWDWDLNTNELLWSPGFKAVFGHETNPDNNEIDFWEKLIHPKDRKDVVDGLNKFLENPETTRWEDTYRLVRSDGSYAEVVDRGFVIRDEAGKPLRMVGAIRDFTERVRFFRLLEEQNKKLREIAWSQSHELRGPLSRILGLVDLIEKRGADEIENPEILGYLEQSAKELDEVIHRIVRMSHDIDLNELNEPDKFGDPAYYKPDSQNGH